ncbi:FAD/NAD(P)-binding protein [Brucella sp. BE17]|uniref:FAD/NAD(P)-binding protein n=1 Tax=Brucella sp. BE17 TaxID=3142977 RepID=UPI0031BA882E
MKTVMIIGGGASGVILAAQVLAHAQHLHIRLFERSGRVGSGIAYSTQNPSHLLNVRAGNMSAFAQQPEHFLHWLQKRSETDGGTKWSEQSYAPRKLYNLYLQDLIAPYLEDEKPRLVIETCEIVGIKIQDGAPCVKASSGASFSGSALIVATGNEAAIAVSGGRVREYWSSSGYFDIPATASVAIFGTGLSMVDSVLSLLDRGHEGPIHALSRRGLVPARHEHVEPFALSADPLFACASLSSLLSHIRALMREAAASGSDWRAVMDSLRPFTGSLWQRLSLTERESFLRHLRPWWDVHRHRMAPRVADRIDAARASGQLQIEAGRLLSVREGENGVAIHYRRRHRRESAELTVATIIDCRGGNPRFSTTRNPALAGLMENGLGRPDPLDLGLDVRDDLRLIDAHGGSAAPIYALGPLTKGLFWEVTAVPDIRVQAAQLAGFLLSDKI